jgi:SAM-dependent methyltransferase
MRSSIKIRAEAFRPPPGRLHEARQLAQGICDSVTDPHDWLHNYVNNHAARFAFDVAHTENLADGHSSIIIDVAAAPFVTSSLLARRGHDVSALDIAPERFTGLCNYLEVNVLKCDIELEQFPLEDNRADIVLLFETFEHLRIDPIFTFSEIVRILRPGGVMLLSTPNLKSLKGLYNYLLRNLSYSCAGNIFEEYSKLGKYGHMGHVREYTRRELVDFARHFRMRCERVIYRGTYEQAVMNALGFALPRLRPFQMLVLRKPDNG